MKKIICFIVLLNLFTVSSIFCQDNKNADFKNGFTFGAFGTLGGNIQGVGFEFGFGLLKKGSFYMRNHLEINGMNLPASPSQAGALGFREKLIIGGNFHIVNSFSIRTYTSIELGFQMLGIGEEGDELYVKFGEAPFILEPRIGAGFEFLFNVGDKKSASIFIEVLKGVQVLTTGVLLSSEYPGLENTYVAFNIGGRGYF